MTTQTGRTLLDAPHVVEFSRTGYGLQHPIACRPDLIRCPLNRWLADQSGPAAKPGRYLMAGPGQFAPLPKGWADPLRPSAIAAIEAEARAQGRAEALAEITAAVGGLTAHFISGYEWECSECHYHFSNRPCYITGIITPHDEEVDSQERPSDHTDALMERAVVFDAIRKAGQSSPPFALPQNGGRGTTRHDISGMGAREGPAARAAAPDPRPVGARSRGAGAVPGEARARLATGAAARAPADTR